MVSTPGPTLIGQSPVFMRVLDLIDRIARYEAPVLVMGETGTGKELAARAIHYRSDRRNGPFVPLNCGAMPEALIESELYGCERGAFTDARTARAGLVHAADGGTLFLDEVDSLAPRAQVSLLRFLQDRTYRTVGGTRMLSGDVRIIAAASPRLGALLACGEFRDDLAFRLNVLQLEMPALRDRCSDIPLLAQHLIERHARQHGLAVRSLDEPSERWITQQPWPGNVRELDNCIQRALLLSDGDALHLMAQAPLQAARSPTPAPQRVFTLGSFNEARDRALERFEREYLEQLLAAAAGNVTRAARIAGKERRCLGKLLKKHGLGHPGESALATR